MKITVRVTGRAYHVAREIPEMIELGDEPTVDDALESIRSQLPSGESLPPSCLVIVSGEHLGTLATHETRRLSDGDQLELIAPVAGG